MADDWDRWSGTFTREPTPIEREMDERTKAGLDRLFYWLIYPRPFGVIAFIVLSWLWRPFLLGALACFLAFTVFWFMRGGGSVATRWMGLAFDLVNGLLVKLLRKTPTMAQRLADEYRIEGQTAVRAASLGTAEGDQQAELQVAGWTELISTNNRAIDNPGTTPEARKQLAFLNAQLRERIRDVRAVYAQPIADPESIGDQRLSFFDEVPRRGFSFGGPLHWYAIGALLLLSGFLGVRGATFEHQRDEALDAAKSLEQANDQLHGALETASRAHAVDTTRRIDQVEREMEFRAEARAREARREERRRATREFENNPDLAPVDLTGQLSDLVEPAGADSDPPGDAPGADPVSAVPGGPEPAAAN